MAADLRAALILSQELGQLGLMLRQEGRQPGDTWRLRLMDLLFNRRSQQIGAVQHVADIMQHAGGDLSHARKPRTHEQLAVDSLEVGLNALALLDLAS